MPLTPGTRLDSYEILGAIGAGGMGEVYRARDSRLDRDVAIKILPELFAADPERAARFEREARTLAALNHPNIAQVFGVIEQPPALVMEFVDGHTLEDLISASAAGASPRASGTGGSGGSLASAAASTRRGLSLEDALPVARQIADALEAAHEQGIIHRDLKPANIKVRADGTVKVLDTYLDYDGDLLVILLVPQTGQLELASFCRDEDARVDQRAHGFRRTRGRLRRAVTSCTIGHARSRRADRFAQQALASVPHWHYVRDILWPQIRKGQGAVGIGIPLIHGPEPGPLLKRTSDREPATGEWLQSRRKKMIDRMVGGPWQSDRARRNHAAPGAPVGDRPPCGAGRRGCRRSADESHRHGVHTCRSSSRSTTARARRLVI